MTLNSPIFILGPHKSGSSLLRSLLDHHPQLFVVPFETHYFQYTGYWVDYRLRQSYPKPLNKINKNDVIESLTKYINNRNTSEDPYADSIVTGWFNVSQFKSFMESHDWETPGELFSVYMKALHLSLTGKEFPDNLRIVEKSVENAEYAVSLRKMFPDSRFIHIVRNPYAGLVAIRRYKGKNSYPFLREAIFSLKNSYYHLYKNQAVLDNYMIVKYEELLTSPETVMREISSFLKIEFADILLQPTNFGKAWGGNSTNNQSFTGVSSAPLKTWKSRVNHLEISLVNAMLSPVLDLFGYEKIVPKKRHYFPVSGEKPEIYIKNRSLFWVN